MKNFIERFNTKTLKHREKVWINVAFMILIFILVATLVVTFKIVFLMAVTVIVAMGGYHFGSRITDFAQYILKGTRLDVGDD